MGLDISAYSRLRRIGEEPSLYANNESGIVVYADTVRFSNRFGPRCDLAPGLYEQSEEGETLTFRAGSYSGYGDWRRNLALLVGWSSDSEAWEAETPHIAAFYEQINFADNEGYIGPTVAAKLAADYEEWESRAKEAWGERDWRFASYRNWRRAFDIAAQDGVVEFH